ncbi:MAG: hypothetical protein LBB79_08830 [Prevotellaceae bacterium]|nr:hypothetical protein [Prevotellaceae bacterium]
MLYISIPQALTYFVDAHSSEAPVSFKGANVGVRAGAYAEKSARFPNLSCTDARAPLNLIANKLANIR